MQYEYYSLLEIERTATAEEIKRAYKKKAIELHPDRHGGDKTKEAAFKKINEAYATLSDAQKKAHYDRFWTSEWMWGMGWGFWWFQWGFDASDLGDIFSSFFGGGFSGSRWRKRADIGEDIEIAMNISLEDAIRGNTRKIEFKKRTTCEDCNGKWWKTTTCETCRGNGRVRERMQTVFGIMEQERECASCGGSGEKITEKCNTCHGKKYKETLIKKDIEIPMGIEDGMSIKMRWEGHGWSDGNGDLYITFGVPSREWWLERDGHTLHYFVRLSPAEAALGCEKIIEIPILGKKTITVKHGTQGEDIEKFTGEWVSRLDKKWAKGDLIVHFIIDIPTKLSSDEKKLYTALLEIQGWKKTEKGFFDTIFQ
jgi:molecular chaperone DnaJ